MLRAWSKRIALCIPIIMVMEATVPPAAHAQRLEEIETSNKQVKKLYREGKYAKATPLAERTLAASERVLGKQHRATLTSVNSLASLYKALGRYKSRTGGSGRMAPRAGRSRNPRGDRGSTTRSTSLKAMRGIWPDQGRQRQFKRPWRWCGGNIGNN